MVDVPRDMIPWEYRGMLGLPRAFWETWRLSMLEPRRFYGLAPREESVWGALLYGLVFDLVVSLVTFVHHLAIGGEELGRSIAPFYPQIREVLPRGPELIDRFMTASAIASLLFTPLSYLFNLLVTVTLTWLGLKMATSLKTTYGRLLKMFAYASWIQIFGLVGVVGDVFLGGLAFLLVLGFGAYYWVVVVRETQRIETGRVVIASLYSCVAGFLISCFVGFPILIGFGWFVYTLLPPFTLPAPQ